MNKPGSGIKATKPGTVNGSKPSTKGGKPSTGVANGKSLGKISKVPTPKGAIS